MLRWGVKRKIVSRSTFKLLLHEGAVEVFAYLYIAHVTVFFGQSLKHIKHLDTFLFSIIQFK